MIEGKWKIDRSYKNICIEMMTENLASLRAKADITQGEISNLIGISRQTYYAIETGQRTMSWNLVLSSGYSSWRNTVTPRSKVWLATTFLRGFLQQIVSYLLMMKSLQEKL